MHFRHLAKNKCGFQYPADLTILKIGIFPFCLSFILSLVGKCNLSPSKQRQVGLWIFCNQKIFWRIFRFDSQLNSMKQLSNRLCLEVFSLSLSPPFYFKKVPKLSPLLNNFLPDLGVIHKPRGQIFGFF